MDCEILHCPLALPLGFYFGLGHVYRTFLRTDVAETEPILR